MQHNTLSKLLYEFEKMIQEDFPSWRIVAMTEEELLDYEIMLIERHKKLEKQH